MNPIDDTVELLEAENKELRKFLLLFIERDLERLGKSDNRCILSANKCLHAYCNQSFDNPFSKDRHETNFRSHALVCQQNCHVCFDKFQMSAFEQYLANMGLPTHLKSLVFSDRKRKHSSPSESTTTPSRSPMASPSMSSSKQSPTFSSPNLTPHSSTSFPEFGGHVFFETEVLALLENINKLLDLIPDSGSSFRVLILGCLLRNLNRLAPRIGSKRSRHYARQQWDEKFTSSHFNHLFCRPFHKWNRSRDESERKIALCRDFWFLHCTWKLGFQDDLSPTLLPSLTKPKNLIAALYENNFSVVFDQEPESNKVSRSSFLAVIPSEIRIGKLVDFSCVYCRRRHEILCNLETNSTMSSEERNLITNTQLKPLQSHYELVQHQQSAFKLQRQALSSHPISDKWLVFILVMDFSPYPRVYRNHITMTESMGFIANSTTSDEKKPRTSNFQALHISICTRSSDSNASTEFSYFDFFADAPNEYAFVETALWRLVDIRESPFKHVRKVDFWSDGGPHHFKIGNTLGFVLFVLPVLIQKKFGGQCPQFSWNFFGPHHGKSACDGHAAHCKLACKNSALDGNILTSPADIARVVETDVKRTYAEALQGPIASKYEFDFKGPIRPYYHFSIGDSPFLDFSKAEGTCKILAFHKTPVSKNSEICIVIDVNAKTKSPIDLSEEEQKEWKLTKLPPPLKNLWNGSKICNVELDSVMYIGKVISIEAVDSSTSSTLSVSSSMSSSSSKGKREHRSFSGSFPLFDIGPAVLESKRNDVTFDFDLTISLINYKDCDNSVVVVRYDHLKKNISPLKKSALAKLVHISMKIEASESAEDTAVEEETEEEEGNMSDKIGRPCTFRQI